MKKNKNLLIILLILTVGLVGLTIAYFANSSTITNEFKTNPYGTTVEENFVAPNNWLPGDTTEKTIVATNTGEVDEAVRISFTESWTPNKAGSTLSGWIHPDGSKSNHTTQTELETDERVALINFTNPSDWTYENGYYYYNYRIEPNESTTSLIESVTFNEHTKLDDTCVTTVEGNVKTITCDSSGSDYDNANYTLTFTVETVQYNKYAEAWELPQNTTIVIAEEKPQPTPAGTQYLATTATNASNAEYNATTKKNMFVFTHGEGANQVTESRYIGNDPNNYVYFNCTNDEDTSTCEKWRIIGTFDVERTDPTDSTKTITETRMKLVRGNSIKNDYWNKASNGNGYNDWTADNATLKLFLNGAYYNNTGDAQTGGYGLQESARNMIEDAKYYLGAFAWNSSLTTEQLYSSERGSTLCGSCGTDTQKLTWIGKVGLMYPSDMYMTYKGVNDACYNTPANSSNCNSTNAANGWVYNSNKLSTDTNPYATWFLSPSSGNSNFVFGANSAGNLSNNGANDSSDGVRPVVYLKSDIKIDGGNGEVGNPYVLK